MIKPLLAWAAPWCLVFGLASENTAAKLCLLAAPAGIAAFLFIKRSPAPASPTAAMPEETKTEEVPDACDLERSLIERYLSNAGSEDFDSANRDDEPAPKGKPEDIDFKDLDQGLFDDLSKIEDDLYNFSEIEEEDEPRQAPKPENIEWIDFGKSYELSGLQLLGGFYINTGGYNPRQANLHCIHPYLLDSDIKGSTYFAPSVFPNLSIDERKEFLSWMTYRRIPEEGPFNSDHTPCHTYLGMLYWRFFVDRDQRDRIVEEAYDLASNAHKDACKELLSRIHQFMHEAAYTLGLEAYSRWLQALLALPELHLTDASLNIIQAYYQISGEEVPFEIAFYLGRHAGYNRNVGSHHGMYGHSFKVCYESAFPQGFKLPRASSTIQLDPGLSPFIPAYDETGLDPIVIPKPHPRHADQPERLRAIFAKCSNEVQIFQSALRNHRDQEDQVSLYAISFLSPEVAQFCVERAKPNWDRMLSDFASRDGIFTGTLSTLYQHTELYPESYFTSQASVYRQLRRLANAFGYTLSPHPSLAPPNMEDDQLVALTPLVPDKLLELWLEDFSFMAIAAILRSAGTKGPATFPNVDTSLRTESYAKLVEGYASVLREQGTRFLPALNGLLKNIDGRKRRRAMTLLAKLAIINGRIPWERTKVLKRICKGCNAQWNDVKRSLQNEHGAKIELSKPKVSKKADSSKPAAPVGPPKELKLDLSKVASISSETQEVGSILGEIFREEEDQPNTQNNPSAPKPAFFADLPDRFIKPAQVILSKQSWSWTDFASVAQKHHLLPDDLFDNLNEWSDEALGDFILEREGDVTVFTKLLDQGMSA